MNDEFQKYWRDNFSNCPPVSYLFKDRLNERWFRIHNLPQSKRYAENEKEMQKILRRQKILFNDVMREEENCFLVCLGYDNENPIKVYKNKFPALCKFFRVNQNLFRFNPLKRKKQMIFFAFFLANNM